MRMVSPSEVSREAPFRQVSDRENEDEEESEE